MTCRKCDREIRPQEIQTREGLCTWCDFTGRPRELAPDGNYYRWVLEADEALRRMFPGEGKL